MNAVQVIALAKTHMNNGPMASSAQLCIADAEDALAAGNENYAKFRAQKSLSYSVGILHEDYKKASA